ncbi:pancreatic lipase-related protein 2-like [Aedes albopictus]|uniref:Lipase domain-containing protein n=1 Tax=Aedes albopictus TaxID=7160 RepID=A0ABM1XRQ9_AEDAL|nr:pancreatic lipase-related protein 2-like [Aedes albopictus]
MLRVVFIAVAFAALLGVRADIFEDTFDLSSEESIANSMNVAFGEYRSELGPLLEGPVDDSLESRIAVPCASRDQPNFETFYDDRNSWKELEFSSSLTIIVHGWLHNSEEVWIRQTAHELMKIHDTTICLVDWNYRARYNYRQAAEEHTPFVADFLTRFILYSNEVGVPLEKVTLIGHNLGAHICGQSGHNLGGRIGAIYGLDPLGPLFEYPKDHGLEMRLDLSDAKYVQVIITSRHELGLVNGEGHENFYPNGGESAANCPLPDTDSKELTVRIACSEWESTEYFKRSLNPNNPYEGKQCSDWPSYLAHRCDFNRSNKLGIYSHRIGGDFYLNAEPILPNYPAFSSHAH